MGSDISRECDGLGNSKQKATSFWTAHKALSSLMQQTKLLTVVKIGLCYKSQTTEKFSRPAHTTNIYVEDIPSMVFTDSLTSATFKAQVADNAKVMTQTMRLHNTTGATTTYATTSSYRKCISSQVLSNEMGIYRRSDDHAR